MNTIADSANNSISPENPMIASVSERYFAQIKESTLTFLRCGRHFDRECQRLQAEHGKSKGKKLFKELIASLGWWYDSATDAINLSRSYFGLPSELLTELDRQPQWWSLEGIKKLLKLSIEQIQKALAQAAAQLGNSLSRFLKPFTPKKFLTPGEPITDENWDAIAELITKKLGLDAEQLEEMKAQAIALAGEEPLTVAHLIQVLEAGKYEVDGLLPPAKAQALKPEEIQQIRQTSKDEGYQRGREEAIAEFQQQFTEQLEQIRREAAQKQQESDQRIQQLEQQLQTLILQVSPQQSGSTVGAQVIATLLKTGGTQQAITVPPSPLKREFLGSQHNSPHKVKSSQKTPSSGKGFGSQSVNQKQHRHG